MSETPVSGNDLAESLNTSLVAFTACIGEALDICSYSLTIGETYVPFNPDEDDECEEEEAACEQAWVRVTDVGVVNTTPDSFAGKDGCAATFQISLEVGVLRCIEVPEGGEAPDATSVLAAAMQAMADMKAIYCAAMNCTADDGSDIWASIHSKQWTPSGPLGGQYGGIWTFDVEPLD